MKNIVEKEENVLHIKQEQSYPYKKIKQAILEMLKIGRFCVVKVVANIGIK